MLRPGIGVTQVTGAPRHRLGVVSQVWSTPWWASEAELQPEPGGETPGNRAERGEDMS